MKQRGHFRTKEERERAHKLWEEEVRKKAIQVIRAYNVTLEEDRIWQVARSLFSSSLPKKVRGLLFHSVLLPPRNGEVTIAVSTTPALVRLRPFLGQIAKDLRLLLGNDLQANLASFDSLLEGSK